MLLRNAFMEVFYSKKINRLIVYPKLVILSQHIVFKNYGIQNRFFREKLMVHYICDSDINGEESKLSMMDAVLTSRCLRASQ